MKGMILGALLLAVGAISGTAIAEEETGSVYITPMGQWYKLDNDRQANKGWGYQLGAGYNFAPEWALEADFSDFATPHRAGGPDLRLYGYTADLIYKLFPQSVIRPYVLGGGGYLRDLVPAYGISRTVALEAGAGLLTALGPQTGFFRMQLRTEAKYRKEFVNTDFDGVKDPGDWLFGVGFQATFGGRQPPPVAKEVVLPPPDSDGDGVPDDIDRCPNTPAGAKVDQYGCEFDQDGDGVVDRLDQCPNTPHGTPVDAKGCPLDSDGDGVPDTIDKCPNTPLGDKVDSVGCTIKDEIKLQGVNFATDSAELVPESAYVLDYAVATLKKFPGIVVEIHGHTDDRGSTKHNVILSQHRAESVMKYLQDHGVTNTMTAKGYGKGNPIADNSTTEGRLENRRVSIRVVSGL